MMIPKIFAFTFVACAYYATGASAQGCLRGYLVRSGDTCNSICQDNNVSTFQLLHVNTQINAGCTNLGLSEKLCLGQLGQDCTVNQEVFSGDTCNAIAANAGIPLSTLLANNPNINAECTNLAVGEVLCTTAQIIPYS